MPDKCKCADMDWAGHDMTKEHHPECPDEKRRIAHNAFAEAMNGIGDLVATLPLRGIPTMKSLFIGTAMPTEGIRLDMATMNNNRPMEVKYYPRKLVARPFSLDEMIKILAERDIAK